MAFVHRGILFATVSTVCIAAPAVAQTRQFDVPAQSLDRAVSALGRQADIQIVAVKKLTRGKSSRSVKGSMTTDRALTIMLDGSGLAARRLGANSYTIVTDPNVARAPGSAETQSAIAMAPAQMAAETGGSALEEMLSAEIVVTGSRIARSMGNSADSVTVIDREAIQKFGASTTGELLRFVPGNQGSAETSPYNTLGSSRFANLRGLGGGSTLVLVNGRRPASSAASFNSGASPAQFNLDTVPIAAIERIEILKDSASAIYGADAIGGVINVILKRDFKGAEVFARVGDVTRGNALERQFGGTVGTVLGSVSLLAGGEYYQRGELTGGDRSFSRGLDKTPLGGSDFGFPGASAPLRANVRSLDGSNLPGLNSPFAATPAISGRPLTIADFQATQGTSNPSLDYTAQGTLVSPQKRWNVFGHASIALSPSVTFELDAIYSESRSRGSFDFPNSGFVVGAQNPYNPFGVDILADFYLTEFPNYNSMTRTSDLNLGAGLKGVFSSSWKWNAATYYGRSRLKQHEFGPDFGALSAALLSPDEASAVNPFFGGIGSRAGVLESLNVDYLNNDLRTQAAGGSAGTTGDLFDFGAGSTKIALGVDYRWESLDTFSSGILAVPGISNRSRNVKAAYAELSAPLVGSAERAAIPLELVGAVRTEDYSDFGGTTNFKAGLIWRPSSAIALRGTYGTAFQAPSLGQLFSPSSMLSANFFAPVFDPVLGETYVPSGNYIYGGNPNLTPQRAKTISLGATAKGRAGGIRWKASLDFYNIRFRDRIRSNITPQELVGLESTFPSLIVRDPATNRIQDLLNIPVNLARVETSGFDLSVEGAMNFAGGELTAIVAGTLVTKYNVQLAPGEPMLDRLNYIGFSNAKKGYVQLSYAREPFAITGTINYAGGYESEAPPQERIDSLITVDLQASYALGSALPGRPRVDFGVINLFDEDPPFYNNRNGFDPGEGDPLGRRVYVRLTLGF
jgi:iron complex outermembrane receptor protein